MLWGASVFRIKQRRKNYPGRLRERSQGQSSAEERSQKSGEKASKETGLATEKPGKPNRGETFDWAQRRPPVMVLAIPLEWEWDKPTGGETAVAQQRLLLGFSVFRPHVYRELCKAEGDWLHDQGMCLPDEDTCVLLQGRLFTWNSSLCLLRLPGQPNRQN